VSSSRCGVGAGLRFLLAACLLGAVMAVMRLTFPRRRALLGVLLYGALIFGGSTRRPQPSAKTVSADPVLPPYLNLYFRWRVCASQSAGLFPTW
jgi:hypothetical protein